MYWTKYHSIKNFVFSTDSRTYIETVFLCRISNHEERTFLDI